MLFDGDWDLADSLAGAPDVGPLGRWFVATFTDEPSLMSLFLRPMPYAVLPWEPQLDEDYRLASGRELAEDLPAIVLDDGPTGLAAVKEGVLVDFLGLVCVPDEDDLDAFVAAPEE